MLIFRHHDYDPHLQYRFGLLPQPLTALPAPRGRNRACLLPSGGDTLKDQMSLPDLASRGDGGWLAPASIEDFMPSNAHHPVRALSDAQLQQFIQDGFVRIDKAFPSELAEQARAIMWRDLPCEPHDPATWTRPVIRLGHYGDEPFRKAVNSPLLYSVFDQLVGKGRWRPRTNLGTFPVRFPHPDDPGDAGWHIDVSFPGPAGSWDETKDFSDWRANVSSRGRALLMLFLFSDVGEFDAYTRIKVGSHLDIARLLEPAGETGMSHAMLDKLGAAIARPEALASGAAGTVYLCHPFLVHAAQMHRGSTPRFMAQPPLHPAEPFLLDRDDGNYSPVEIAIRHALQQGRS